MKQKFDFDTLAEREGVGCMKLLETPGAVRKAGTYQLCRSGGGF